MSDARDRSLRRRAFVGTLSNYAGRLATLATWLLLTPYILHSLGPTEYGLWVLVGSVAWYGWLFNLGIEGTLTKYVAEYRARGDTPGASALVATALRLYSLLGLLTILAGAAVAPLFPRVFNVPPEQHATSAWLLFLVAVEVGLALPCSTPQAVLRGLHRHDAVNLVNTVRNLLLAGGVVVALALGGGVLGMAVVSIAAMLVVQVLSLVFIRRTAPDLAVGWRGARRDFVRGFVSFSAPLFVMELADTLQRKTDEIVIGLFLPVRAVTPYALARRLSELARTLTSQLVPVLLPLSSELQADNDAARLRTLYTASTRLTLAIFMPLGAALAVLAGPLLTVWVGSEYAPYAPLVVVLVAAALCAASQSPATAILQGMARHRALAVGALVSAVANLALSVALVPSLGLLGVALGTLIPTAAESLLFRLPYTMRALGVGTGVVLRWVAWPTLAPVAPMLLTLLALRQALAPESLPGILVVAGAGSLVYLAGYLLVGATPTEREVWRSLVAGTLRLARGRLRRAGA